MSWTQADVDALKKAIAEGVRVVQRGDRRVEYRSLDEMRQVLAMVQGEVSPPTKPVRAFRVSPRSGY